MSGWFSSIDDVVSLKEEYRRLSKKLHPDAGGDAEEFGAMKDEFQARLKMLTSDKPVLRNPRCRVCEGRGRITITNGFNSYMLKCSACKGFGYDGT